MTQQDFKADSELQTNNKAASMTTKFLADILLVCSQRI